MSNLPAIIDIAPTPAVFSYDQVDAETGAAIRDAEIKLRSLLDQNARTRIEIGLVLLTVRDKIDRGLFGKWLVAINIRSATAYNLIDAAKHFSDKIPIVGSLQPTTIYALAAHSTPEALRADITGRLEAGATISDAEIKGEIKEAVRARRQAAEEDKKAAIEAAKTPEERQKEKVSKARRKKSQEEREAKLAEDQARARAEKAAREEIYDLIFAEVASSTSRARFVELMSICKYFNGNELLARFEAALAGGTEAPPTEPVPAAAPTINQAPPIATNLIEIGTADRVARAVGLWNGWRYSTYRDAAITWVRADCPSAPYPGEPQSCSDALEPFRVIVNRMTDENEFTELRQKLEALHEKCSEPKAA